MLLAAPLHRLDPVFLKKQQAVCIFVLTSAWRLAPHPSSRRTAFLCTPSSQFCSRWQDAVVWTWARVWKRRQGEKIGTETWKEEAGEHMATKTLLENFAFPASQQIHACARLSPAQATPPASRPDRADTCASVLGATWGNIASWSQDSASQTGNGFCAVISSVFIISINDQYREHCHSL